MAFQASVPYMIMGSALIVMFNVSGPSPRARVVHENGTGFNRFHQEMHQLVTPQTAVKPYPGSELFYEARATHDQGIVHAIVVTPTMNDTPREAHAETSVYKLVTNHGWHEDVKRWSPSFRKMVTENMGITGESKQNFAPLKGTPQK